MGQTGHLSNGISRLRKNQTGSSLNLSSSSNYSGSITTWYDYYVSGRLTLTLFQAPGEADADLGYLDEFECIDGILTDDGDVALFGARRILRRFVQVYSSGYIILTTDRMNKDKQDEITVYSSESLQKTLGLTRGGLLLLAILGGGDYDTV